MGFRDEALRATQKAVAIWRDLAGQEPSAFLSDLARGLDSLGKAFSDLGQREEALKVSEEAVQCLASSFLRGPAAFYDWMDVLARNYIQLSEAFDQEPDDELLWSIMEVLADEERKRVL